MSDFVTVNRTPAGAYVFDVQTVIPDERYTYTDENGVMMQRGKPARRVSGVVTISAAMLAQLVRQAARNKGHRATAGAMRAEAHTIQIIDQER